MKLKKLLSIVTASAVAIVYMCSAAITSFADPAHCNIIEALKESGYANFTDFINDFSNGSADPVCTIKAVNGSLPTKITYDQLKALGNRTLTLKIEDPWTSVTYSAIIDGSQVTTALKDLEVNFALDFDPTPNELRLYAYTYVNSDIGLPITYKIEYASWSTLITQSGIPLSIDAIDCISIKDNSQKISTEYPDANVKFLITDICRTGVYFEESGANTDWITKKEAVAYAKALLLKQIGLTEAQINGTDSNFTSLKNYFDEAVKAAKEEINNETATNYVDKDSIDDMIDAYLAKDANKVKLAEAVIATKQLEDKIADEISEVLGGEITVLEQKTLVQYIKDSVSEEVISQIGTYETPSNLIVSTVNKAVDTAVASKVEVLKNDILNAITGGQTVADFVASLKGEQGEQGEQGVPGTAGENFEEWVVRRYGSEENFIQYIVSRVSMGVNDGKSAYELAVDNGYIGTLTEWLDSLKGEDGKSAYQIAVDLGFEGSEEEWLETLGSDDERDVIETEEEENEGEVPEEENEEADDSIFGDDGEDYVEDEVNGTYEDLEDYEDEEGPDPDSEPVEEPPYEDDYSDDVTLDDDAPQKYPFNPSTGVTLGILLPVAAIGSILLVKKGKRKRGRR